MQNSKCCNKIDTFPSALSKSTIFAFINVSEGRQLYHYNQKGYNATFECYSVAKATESENKQKERSELMKIINAHLF